MKVAVVLDRIGRALLMRAKGHLLAVTEQITVAGGAVRRRRIELRLVPAVTAAPGSVRLAAGSVEIRLGCDGLACHGTITLSAGRTRLTGPRPYHAAPGRTVALRLPLGPAGRRLLATAAKTPVTAVVEITVAGGIRRRVTVRLRP